MKLYLAHDGMGQGSNTLLGEYAPKAKQRWKGVKLGTMEKPSLLVSFFYVNNFLKYQHEYHYRDWALDSGAFSAFNSGKTIDLLHYIEFCKERIAQDKTLVEVFALDVIGNHKQSLKNTEIMWKAGIPAIPTYHFSSPVDALKYIAKTYPKIAIGGVAKKIGNVKTEFARQCFAHTWPKKIHGFGYGSENHIMQFPFHSCDATNWELSACAFGRWNAFGKMSVRGSTQNLRAEVEFYLKLEQKARSRWTKEMERLGALPDKPDVRLVLDLQRTTQHTKRLKAIQKGFNGKQSDVP